MRLLPMEKNLETVDPTDLLEYASRFEPKILLICIEVRSYVAGGPLDTGCQNFVGIGWGRETNMFNEFPPSDCNPIPGGCVVGWTKTGVPFQFSGTCVDCKT
jgi:hypothetical protein